MLYSGSSGNELNPAWLCVVLRQVAESDPSIYLKADPRLRRLTPAI